MAKVRYDNPAGLIASSVVLEVVVTFCVGLRFYSRRWKRQRVLISDWLVLAAFVFGTALTVVEIYGVKEEALGYPIGGTIEDPRVVTGRLNKAKHIELSYLLLGITALGLIKLSICFLYWDIFAKFKFRRFLVIWMIIIGVWATSFVLAGLLECGSHLKALFGHPQEYLDHCGSAITTGWAMVGSDVATDLITLIIPIPVVLGLHMSTHRKVLTLLTFLIGALSVGASITKAYIYIAASLNLYKEDAILILTGLSIWNLVEVQVGIIAACGPTLPSVLSHLLPTDSIKSFVDSFGSSWSRKSKVSSEMPSFVKLPESEEGLKREASGVSNASSLRTGQDQYDIEMNEGRRNETSY